MTPIGNGSDSLANAAKAVAAPNTLTLDTKILSLRRSRSSDAIQQMQTEAIVELYDLVKQIQKSLSPMPPVIPDVDAVREAAAKAAAAAALKNSAKSGFKRFP